MIFLFKQKNIVLDCFTTNHSVFEFAKPDISSKFLPDWWKEIPKTYTPPDQINKRSTVRQCDGLINHYKHGIVLPMWCDLQIELGPEGTPDCRWQFSDGFSFLDYHDFRQFNNYLSIDKLFHAKLISHWQFKCSETIPWVWMQPTWNLIEQNQYTVIPGTVEYKYQHGTNINLMLHRSKETQSIFIPFRKPLVQITPLSDRKIKLKYHLVDENEIKKINYVNVPITFINKYKNEKKFYRNKK